MTDKANNSAHATRWTYSIIVTALFVLFVAGTTQFGAWYARPLFNQYLTIGNVGFLALTILPIVLAYFYLRNGYRTAEGKEGKEGK
jgi:purine-cytosine permease-like protein